MFVNDFFITDDVCISDVMKQMDDLGMGMLLIGHNGKLDAVITDGDIRKYYIAHGNLNEQVKKIANYQPKVMKSEDAAEVNIKKFIARHKLKFLPIIDNQDKIQRIEFENGTKILKKIEEDRNTRVVIMGGGKGTRLAPLTNILPKPLIPVGDKTILEHILDKFSFWGYKDFDVIINYKKEIIKAFFSENIYENKEGINIRLWEEGKFLGTAGGLKILEKDLHNTFILSNCDVLVDADYQDLLKRHNIDRNIITVLVAPKKIMIPYGTIETGDRDQIISMKEKPTYCCLINTGVYVVEPQVIELIEKDTFVNFTDIIQKCIELGERVGTYRVNEGAWMDMGEISELRNMESVLNDAK